MNVSPSPVAELAARLRASGLRVLTEEPLSRYTTIGLGGPAEVMVFPSSTEELLTVIRRAIECGLAVRVLGGGSNLLVRDEGVRGVVVATGRMKMVRFQEGGRVEAEGGSPFPALVRAAASRGLAGLEAGVGIPGSLGGVVAMNAGAYGFSIGDWVERVTVVTPESGRLDLSRDQIHFRYRSSSLGDDVVVARCLLKLIEEDPRVVRARLSQHMEARKSSQPIGVKSAGCIFKNPPGESAGRLIDRLGLKLSRIGGAWVSDVHANFIVHDGNATARDVATLIQKIKEEVHRATSIELEEEIKRWV